jgi:glyceraldehyde 3-phosphate dehydrogenase
VLNVSVVDLTCTVERSTTVAEVNAILETAATQGPLKGILTYNALPLVSIDFNHNPASAIFDATQTKVMDRLVKVLAWYDNEWGFSHRMLDTAMAWMAITPVDTK